MPVRPGRSPLGAESGSGPRVRHGAVSEYLAEHVRRPARSPIAKRRVGAVLTRDRIADALSVTDLDAWMARLAKARVTVLEPPYRLGGLRAVMIEGPSREAIELVEIR